MINYLKSLNKEKIIEKLKPLAISAVCLLAVFLAGYGVGKTSDSSVVATSKRSLNYTTAPKEEQKPDNTPAATKETPTTVDPNNCYIKGSKSKTYHVPGGAFYDRTTPAACFNSEDEAMAAGYKKSSR